MPDNPERNRRTATDLNPLLPASGLPTHRLSDLNRVFGALNSPLRLQLILLLNEREHFVNEMAERLDKSQPLISQHLRILKLAKIVDFRRQGRETVYRLMDEHIIDVIELTDAVSGGSATGWIAPSQTTRPPQSTSSPQPAQVRGEGVLPDPDREAAESAPAMAPVDEELEVEENTDEA